MQYRYTGSGTPEIHPSGSVTVMELSVSVDNSPAKPAGRLVNNCSGGLYHSTTVTSREETLVYFEDHDLSPSYYFRPWDQPFQLESHGSDSGIRLHKPPFFRCPPLAQTWLEEQGVFYQVITVILQKNSQWGIYVYDPNCTLEGTSLRYDPIAQLNVCKSETECSVSVDILRELSPRMHLACISLPFTLGILPENQGGPW